MKTYEGKRTIDGIVVTVDGGRLPEHYEVKQFTKYGFEWTYEGESPQQLALAILCDYLGDKQKIDFVQRGPQADDKALQIKPDYVDAMVYKGLLLRLQANLEKDPSKQQQLIKEATELHDKAEAAKKKTTGAND